MSDMNTIGNRIVELRKERGYSQTSFAKVIPVRRETLTKWELGERDLKTDSTIRIAELLGVSCDEILTGRKADNTDVYTRTGLSDKAVEILESRFKPDCDRLAILNFLFECGKMEELCNTILLNSYVEFDYQNRKELAKNNYELNNQKVIVQTTEATNESGSSKKTMIIDYGEYHKFHRFRLANALQKIAEKTCEYMVEEYLPERDAAEKKKYGKSE